MRYTFLAATLLSAFLTAGIAACSGNSMPGAATTERKPSAAHAAPGHLYVANLFGNSVTVYVFGSKTPARTITTGVKAPSSVAFDRSGNLYVANEPCCKYGSGFVSIFAPGATAPMRTIHGFSAPNSLTFDSAGNLVVVDSEGNYSRNGTVSVFASGANAPKRKISWGFNRAWSAVVDHQGNIYVDDIGYDDPGIRVKPGAVYVFQGSATTPSRTIAAGFPAPNAVALGANDDVYVAQLATPPPHGAVDIYGSAGSVQLGSITAGLQSPADLAFDVAGNLYVINGGSGAGAISIYAPDKTYLRTIKDAIQWPTAMAFDPSGNLYVANQTSTGGTGWVSVYPSGATKSVMKITNGINRPFSIAIGP